MIIQYTTKEKELLARIMRAEALAEGDLGMLMVGNVVVNRVCYTCKPFRHIKTIYDAINQKNQFEGITIPLFKAQATSKEKEMAIEILLEAKGFNDVVASVSDTGVDIVVNKQSLETSQKAQIEDIAKRKTGMTSDKININVIK